MADKTANGRHQPRRECDRVKSNLRLVGTPSQIGLTDVVPEPLCFLIRGVRKVILYGFVFRIRANCRNHWHFCKSVFHELTRIVFCQLQAGPEASHADVRKHARAKCGPRKGRNRIVSMFEQNRPGRMVRFESCARHCCPELRNTFPSKHETPLMAYAA